MCVTIPNFVEIGQMVAKILQFNHFYRGTLCQRGISCHRVSVCPSICPSVRPSQAGIVSKWLHSQDHANVTHNSPGILFFLRLSVMHTLVCTVISLHSKFVMSCAPIPDITGVQPQKFKNILGSLIFQNWSREHEHSHLGNSLSSQDI